MIGVTQEIADARETRNLDAAAATKPDTRVCRICDGGPGNDGPCLCGFKKWTRVSEAMVDKALRAQVPGGSSVWVWIIGQDDAWKPHEAARCVIRAALEAVLNETAAP